MDDVRDIFPWLVRNPDAIYADSAATALKPEPVLRAANHAFTDLCANPGRGTYRTATRTTAAIEAVREKVAGFIGATSTAEVAFTSGATASLNAFVASWGEANLRDGDAVMVSSADHAASIRPWHALAQRMAARGVTIEIIDFALNDSGDASVSDIELRCDDRVKVIALTHVHNVFGDRTSVKRIREAVGPEVRIVLDAAQSIGHLPVDVYELGVDALAFSGHKMFASMGVGVLWAAPRIHEELTPMVHGGHGTGTGGVAARFEAGTPNVPAILSLGAAIDFIDDIGLHMIESRLNELTLPLVEGLLHVPGIEFLPGVVHCSCRVGYGIVAFRLHGQDAADVGFMLDDRDISVRTGSHCSGDDELAGDSIRVSLHVYNTLSEVERIVAAVTDLAVGDLQQADPGVRRSWVTCAN